jgi:thioredoxin-like negative regulator of GroEL
MNRPVRMPLSGLLAVCALCALCACAKKAQAPPDVIPITAQTFTYEVLRQPGVTLVLFYTADSPQSREMQQRLDWLSTAYKGQLKFCAFAWDTSADPAPYRLEMLPSLVMYRDGWEIDRMRGIPATLEQLRGLNDDLELWVLRTGLQRTSDARFQAQFSYRFNNDNRLEAGN